MDTNGWKFYIKPSGWSSSSLAFAVIHRTIGDDYFYKNGDRYNGSFSQNLILTRELKEISFETAMALLNKDSVRDSVCKVLKINPNVGFQGPPNPAEIDTIKSLLKSKRAFCADSAYETNKFDTLTINYLIAQKEVFRSKNEIDKYYIPEE